MDKRRNRKYSNNWNNQKKSDHQQRDNRDNREQRDNRENRDQREQNKAKVKQFQFNKALYEDPEDDKRKQEAIKEIKAREVLCPICNEPITDIATAIADKASGKPAHFDCILNQIKSAEPVGENEKISYIGQGRFAVLYFENPRDQRHFTIKKVIEYEDKEHKAEWRDELSSLYSQVK